MALDKVESICKALDCTPNDILEFTSETKIQDLKDTQSNYLSEYQLLNKNEKE